MRVATKHAEPPSPVLFPCPAARTKTARRRTSRALAFSLAAAALLACGGQTSSASESGDGFGGGAVGKGGAAGVGASIGGASGAPAAGGSEARAGTGGVASVEPGALSWKRPGRPRSLSYAGGALYWIVGADQDHPDGAVEAANVTGDATVRTVFPSAQPISCFAVAADEGLVWAIPGTATGGIVRRDVSGGQPVVIVEDGAQADALVVQSGYAYRIRSTSRSASWIERVDLGSGSVDRVGASDEDDAYVGTLVGDGQAIFFSQEGFGSASGIFRVPNGTVEATYLAGDGADRFSLAPDALVRVESYGGTSPTPRAVDRIPTSGGPATPLGSVTATSVGKGIALGGWFYLPLRALETSPWVLARVPLAGGEAEIVSSTLCAEDRWLPSLAVSETMLFVACPGEGIVRAVPVP